MRRKFACEKRTEHIFYCLNCNVPMFYAEFSQHLNHEVVRNLTPALLQDPSQFLRPLDDDKVQAQYFFDCRALKFFAKCFSDLNVNKVICMGAPRLHAHLRRNCPEVQSFLLDFDHRFFYFFDDNQFAWYNMCNNYFFDEEQEINFRKFLKCDEPGRLLIFTDPPFGCRTEPIAHTIRQLTKLYNYLNDLPYQPIPVFWIFPYFAEHYIQQEMPSLQMCDYKVNYTNHTTYTNMGEKCRKLGSPVRVFTNVPLERLQLPVEEEYKYCSPCKRYTSLENRHCNVCETCPSKNGSTYRHCNRCGLCVKPSYAHCMSCRRCTQVEGHVCREYQSKQRCWICMQLGHTEVQCEVWRSCAKKMVTPKLTNGGQETVITCLLCGRLGHNERGCKKRANYIQETSFLGETRLAFKV